MRHLERGVLVALASLGRCPASWRGLLEALDPARGAGTAEIPWYAGYDERIPVCCEHGTAELGRRILDTCRAVGIHLREIRSRVVEPHDFNARLACCGNKSTLLSEVTLGLAAELAGGLAGPVSIICDKHGAATAMRTCWQHFPEAFIEIHGESRHRSAYRFGPAERRIDAAFLTNAEPLPAGRARFDDLEIPARIGDPGIQPLLGRARFRSPPDGRLSPGRQAFQEGNRRRPGEGLGSATRCSGGQGKTSAPASLSWFPSSSLGTSAPPRTSKNTQIAEFRQGSKSRFKTQVPPVRCSRRAAQSFPFGDWELNLEPCPNSGQMRDAKLFTAPFAAKSFGGAVSCRFALLLSGSPRNSPFRRTNCAGWAAGLQQPSGGGRDPRWCKDSKFRAILQAGQVRQLQSSRFIRKEQ